MKEKKQLKKKKKVKLLEKKKMVTKRRKCFNSIQLNQFQLKLLTQITVLMKLNIKMTLKKNQPFGFISKTKMKTTSKLEVVLSKLNLTKHLLQDMVKLMEKVSNNTLLNILMISKAIYKQLKRMFSSKKWKIGKLMLINYLSFKRIYKLSTKEKMKLILLLIKLNKL